MRIACWLWLLAACEQRKPADDKAKPEVAVRPIVVVDAAVAVDAGSVVPRELAAAPARITRHVSTGMATPRHTAETYTLQLAGDRALLVEKRETGVARDPLGIHLDRWELAATKQRLGTVNKQTLTFDDLVLECMSAKQAVAAEGAVRVPGPQVKGAEACGDKGRFAPRATTTIDVLRCKQPGDASDTPSLVFAAPPGIEWIHVNDDCAMQGGGWRRIAKDGSIAPMRDTKDK